MGEERDVRYRVPNVNQCKECHQSQKVIEPIGPKPRNLNKSIANQEGSMNQFMRWHQEGWIKNDFEFTTMADWNDMLASVNDRAIAYLDINCGLCHIVGGSADTTGLYLDFQEYRKLHLGYYKKPIATGRASNNLKYSIVPGKPEESILLYRMESLDPGIMMPESGRSLTHREAIEMIRDWIAAM